MKKTSYFFICILFIIFTISACYAEKNTDTVADNSMSSIAEVPAIEEKLPEPESIPSIIATPVIEEEPPDNDWQFDMPENHGVDGTILEKLHDAIKGIEMYSVVIIKDGYIIDEYYKDGYDENSVFRLNSCTKSVMSSLIGIAIDKGLIIDVEQRLTEFFPQLIDSDSAYKKEITIANLLEHTSGIKWPESSGPMFQQLVNSENWVDFVLSQPMAAKPGSIFNYSTGGSHLLSAIIQQVTGETAYDFGMKHLFEPLGMDSVKWNTDPQGITDGGNGISMSARDAAKFGQLYLDGGMWKGQQIVPEAWVTDSTSPQSKAQPTPGYGYQWWLRKFGELGSYYAVGHAGQYIVVVPELRLVAVSTGRFPSGGYPFLNFFKDYVLAACGY